MGLGPVRPRTGHPWRPQVMRTLCDDLAMLERGHYPSWSAEAWDDEYPVWLDAVQRRRVARAATEGRYVAYERVPGTIFKG